MSKGTDYKRLWKRSVNDAIYWSKKYEHEKQLNETYRDVLRQVQMGKLKPEEISVEGGEQDGQKETNSGTDSNV